RRLGGEGPESGLPSVGPRRGGGGGAAAGAVGSRAWAAAPGGVGREARLAGCGAESPRRRSEAFLARANDFISGLGSTAGAAHKEPWREPARPAGVGRPMLLNLRGLPSVGRPALSAAAREAEQLQQLARLLNLPAELMANAYDAFSRHATAPEATPGASCRSLLQEGRLSRQQLGRVVHDLLGGASGDTVAALADEAFRVAEKDGSNEIDFGQYAIWISSRSFSELLNLTADQISMRDLARKHGMAHSQVEQYKKYFDNFDTDGSGSIDRDEFETILSKCARLPKGTALPQQKVQTLWRLADSDGSRELDFQEFLVFYKRYFDGDGFENMYRFQHQLRSL
ncbi:unnamed protein product, partial [Prorocentrum cordatum]